MKARLSIWTLLLSAVPVWGQGGLAEASLEQLLETRVTSVSKKEQKLSRTAAAVFVITQEDIQRSGASTLPDLLRMAPGVDVAQINTNSWAISIRGFNSRYSNKVLVLVDGRSVYTPTFSGVYWEHLDLPLEDIERIEVIRGPGASVWGANAVNGVINIITKPAAATQGGRVSAMAGSEVYAGDALRYGARAGARGAYRVFAQYGHNGGSLLGNGAPAADGWARMHAGFRSDWELSREDGLTVEGESFTSRQGEMLRSSFWGTPFDRLSANRASDIGGDLLARWTHTAPGGSGTELQAYYDTYQRTEFGVREDIRTFDLDFQDHLALGARHDVVWGSGYRVTASSAAGQMISFTPPSRTDRLYSGFFQDEIQVGADVWLTVGSKLEHNSYTGFEVEPNVRIAWVPSNRHTLWAAFGRSIRQPARVETSIAATLASIPLDANTTEILRLIGNPALDAETAIDFEAGWRTQFSSSASLDVATYLTKYRKLTTIEPGTPGLLPGVQSIIEVPLLYENLSSALDYGGEVALTWNATPRWRIVPNYSFLHMNVRVDPQSQDTTSIGAAICAPTHMAGVRSLVDLTRKVEFDQWLSWTGRLPGTGVAGYARLDARIARRFGESVEISLGGENLLRPGTVQFGDFNRVVSTAIQRSVYGKIQWTF